MKSDQDLSSSAHDFIKQLNLAPKLFNETPKNIFQASVHWPIFNSKIKKPFIIYVCRPGLTGIDFHIERSEPLALGSLHFLYSSNLQVGYVFEIDFAPKIEYDTNYLLAHKPNINWAEAKKIDAEVPLTNQFITVYSHGEELILAVRKKFVFPIIKP